MGHSPKPWWNYGALEAYIFGTFRTVLLHKKKHQQPYCQILNYLKEACISTLVYRQGHHKYMHYGCYSPRSQTWVSGTSYARYPLHNLQTLVVTHSNNTVPSCLVSSQYDWFPSDPLSITFPGNQQWPVFSATLPETRNYENQPFFLKSNKHGKIWLGTFKRFEKLAKKTWMDRDLGIYVPDQLADSNFTFISCEESKRGMQVK